MLEQFILDHGGATYNYSKRTKKLLDKAKELDLIINNFSKEYIEAEIHKLEKRIDAIRNSYDDFKISHGFLPLNRMRPEFEKAHDLKRLNQQLRDLRFAQNPENFKELIKSKILILKTI